MPDKKNWKKIGPFTGMLYAEMAGGILQDQDIPYTISQDGISAAYNIHAATSIQHAVYIWVRNEDFQVATDLLNAMLSDPDDVSEDPQ